MGNLAFCIHGHFYQPPREDPLTGIIPAEPGASPYRNWNERIHAECYRPNIEAHNLEKISFNLGPTLASWMNEYDPQAVQHLVEQDQANVRRYGLGNAIAQPFNHTILPLAIYRDKATQVAWGIADFIHRFGRRPRGMWLPETAVDTETLLVLADNGIEFTILAPWQANTANLDPTEPYWVSLPGKRRIAIFFYHGELSGKVSFEAAATDNADRFARNELLTRFSQEKAQRNEPQLLIIASDGELYGHHKPLRDHFLNHLMNGASSAFDLVPTFPALWLRDHPPRRMIALRYNTSWSCHHGIRRWDTGCPCTPGNSNWKYHLRSAFNRLAAALDELYYDHVSRFVVEPWELRNRYIQVVLGVLTPAQLISEMSRQSLDSAEIQRIHYLLESQYERQRMFTSCGFYFENFDRIEPKNNVAYAAQAVWMAYMATGLDLTDRAAEWLKDVVSQSGNLRADQVFLKHLLRAQTSERSMPGR